MSHFPRYATRPLPATLGTLPPSVPSPSSDGNPYSRHAYSRSSTHFTVMIPRVGQEIRQGMTWRPRNRPPPTSFPRCSRAPPPHPTPTPRHFSLRAPSLFAEVFASKP